MALEHAGCSAEEAIGVGDSVWDIQAAEEAGVRTVTVTADGASSRAELEEVGAYSVYKDCVELLEDGFPKQLESPD